MAADTTASPISEPADLSQLKTILIVDEDVEMGFLLCSILREERHWHVLFATDGRQALKMVSEVRPDLCVLGYHLPDLDGLELARTIRATPGYAHVPMLLMCAHPPQSLVAQHSYLFLECPFDLDAFVGQIKDLLA